MRCSHCGKSSIFPGGHCILCGRPSKQPTIVDIPRRRAKIAQIATGKQIGKTQKVVLSDADKDHVQQTYKTHTVRQTAELLGFPYATVRRVLHERGVMRGAGGGWNDKKVRKILSSGVGDDIVSTYKTHTLNETAKILSIPRLRVRDFLASRGLLKAKGVREWSM